MWKPIINDVTTSFTNPPKFDKLSEVYATRDYSYVVDFIELQKSHYPDIRPFILDTSLSESFGHVTHAVTKGTNWEIISIDNENRKVEAVATTKFLKFKDDVVIEVRLTSTDGVEVHMRSKSRVGKGDLGANARRIKSFFKILSEYIKENNTHR